MSRALWICGALAVLAGCNRPNWSTPVDAYQSFLRALSKGESEVAFGAFSAETRRVLEARAEEISRLSGGAVRDDAAALLFVSVLPTSEVVEVKQVRQEGDRATVSVKTNRGGVEAINEVQLVREKDGWRISLPVTGAEPSAPTPPPPAPAAGVPAADAGAAVDGAR